MIPNARPKQKFEEIVDSIFVNKNNYENFSDLDKQNSFYIINKKFYLGYPKISNFLNHKSIDKDSAIDLWNLYLKKINGIPGWYWSKSNKDKSDDKKIPKADKELIMEYENLSESEFEFLYKYYQDDIDYEIKLLKRLEK